MALETIFLFFNENEKIKEIEWHLYDFLDGIDAYQYSSLRHWAENLFWWTDGKILEIVWRPFDLSPPAGSESPLAEEEWEEIMRANSDFFKKMPAPKKKNKVPMENLPIEKKF